MSLGIVTQEETIEAVMALSFPLTQQELLLQTFHILLRSDRRPLLQTQGFTDEERGLTRSRSQSLRHGVAQLSSTIVDVTFLLLLSL